LESAGDWRQTGAGHRRRGWCKSCVATLFNAASAGVRHQKGAHGGPQHLRDIPRRATECVKDTEVDRHGTLVALCLRRLRRNQRRGH
jgi:hypothetical protein